MVFAPLKAEVIGPMPSDLYPDYVGLIINLPWLRQLCHPVWVAASRTLFSPSQIPAVDRRSRREFLVFSIALIYLVKRGSSERR